MPQQAYRRANFDECDQGLGCTSCAVFVLAMVFIGGLVCYLLLRVYGYV